MDHFGPNVTTGADMTVNLVFWQNSLSIHQAPFLKAVAEQAPAYGIGEVVLNVERSVNSERRAQGWSNPDYGPVRINVGSERPSISAFGAYDQHIFSGFCETAFNRKAFESALAAALIIVLSPTWLMSFEGTARYMIIPIAAFAMQ